MIFNRVGKYVSASDEGYSICACCVVGGWAFVVFGPETKAVPGDYKVRYALGERVPPSFGFKHKYVSECLGSFLGRDYENEAAAAREAAVSFCVKHYSEGRLSDVEAA